MLQSRNMIPQFFESCKLHYQDQSNYFYQEDRGLQLKVEQYHSSSILEGTLKNQLVGRLYPLSIQCIY